MYRQCVMNVLLVIHIQYLARIQQHANAIRQRRKSGKAYHW